MSQSFHHFSFMTARRSEKKKEGEKVPKKKGVGEGRERKKEE